MFYLSQVPRAWISDNRKTDPCWIHVTLSDRSPPRTPAGLCLGHKRQILLANTAVYKVVVRVFVHLLTAGASVSHIRKHTDIMVSSATAAGGLRASPLTRKDLKRRDNEGAA